MSVPRTEKELDDKVSSGGMSEKAFEVILGTLLLVVFIAWVAFLGSLVVAFIVALEVGMADFWSTVGKIYLPCCGVLAVVFAVMLRMITSTRVR